MISMYVLLFSNNTFPTKTITFHYQRVGIAQVAFPLTVKDIMGILCAYE